MDWDKITPELERKLDPKYVKPPPQGKYGSYIEGWHAISEANRIFGFNGWSYTISNLQLTNASEDGGKHRVGYMALVTVCVDGVQRGDVGHGQGFGKSEGDAHDSAVKEAVTDALKRALRTFGNPFGLALYDKSGANVGVDLDPEDRDNAAVKWFTAQFAKADSIPKLEAWFADPARQSALGRLSEEGRIRVDVARQSRCAELSALAGV